MTADNASLRPPSLPEWLTPSAATLADFAALLAGPGVERGLIGPREVPRLWERHLLNCAVVADPELGLVPLDCVVADVGSGAGLPGLVWAISRPDLRVVLIEPLLRRVTFLTEAVSELGLTGRVEVWRGRAEETGPHVGRMDVVTARAVAPMERLVGWTAPLLRPGGRLVALKGSSASAEAAAAEAAVLAAGLVEVRVLEVGAGVVDPLTTVVLARRRAAE
jgi:16S rRNA (guanine527-N7)-methyltransferase